MTALVLMALSFLVLAMLMGARFRRARDEASDLERRARVSRELVRYALKGGEAPQLAVSSRIERKVIVEVGLDTASIIQGEPKTRLLAYFSEIGLDTRLRRQAVRGPLRDRLNAIEALRLFPGEETAAVLRKLLNAKSLRIWQPALRTLMEIGAGPDMFGLLDLAARPGAPQSYVIYQVIAARAHQNLPEALNAMLSQQPGVARALLVRAVGDAGADEALAPLTAALLDADPEVRAAAARALGGLGKAEAADGLVYATTDSDWRVRLRACESIGRLGLWQQALSLEPLLHDPVWWVRFRAEEALRKLNQFGLDSLQEADGMLNRDAHAIKPRNAAAGR